MRDDFTLDELTLFLRTPEGKSPSRNYAGSSWDPALEKVARGWLFCPSRTILAIIRRAEQLRREQSRSDKCDPR